jgi:D-glycero-D-manno-heptose 1,7-bisphosphate phosphatase
MNKAAFLDRDGVILNNEHHYYIWDSGQITWVDGVFESLQLLQDNGYQLFIVSNQGGISRGMYSKSDVIQLHNELLDTFRIKGIEILDILFCPHHNEHEKCLCRKPQGLMIEKLIARYRLEKQHSIMIGDSESDMLAAKEAGITGFRIEPNKDMLPYLKGFLK